MSDVLLERITSLEKEVQIGQELLATILFTIAEPVVITAETRAAYRERRINGNPTISVEVEEETLIVSLIDVEPDSDS